MKNVEETVEFQAMQTCTAKPSDARVFAQNTCICWYMQFDISELNRKLVKQSLAKELLKLLTVDRELKVSNWPR